MKCLRTLCWHSGIGHPRLFFSFPVSPWHPWFLFDYHLVGTFRPLRFSWGLAFYGTLIIIRWFCFVLFVWVGWGLAFSGTLFILGWICFQIIVRVGWNLLFFDMFFLVVGIWSWLSLFCFNFWIAPLKSSYSGAVYTNVLVGVPLSSIVGVVISISDQWKGFAVVSFRALFGGVGDADDIS